jgi:hypothetical protein
MWLRTGSPFTTYAMGVAADEVAECLGNCMFEKKSNTPTQQPPPDTGRLTAEEVAHKLRDPHFLPALAELRPHLEGISWANQDQWLKVINDPKHRVFEILTKEYVDALAGYLSQRAFELGGTPENPITILEVGAGNGRLTHFLSKSFSSRPESCAKVVATDSGEWIIGQSFPVEQLGHQEAIDRHQPTIIIFSWMPAYTDLTSDFRKASSVKEYLLIGEPDEGSCGDPWDTWGRDHTRNAPGTFDANWIPPHEADGFTRHNLKDLSELQLSRLSVIYLQERSETVAFIRSGASLDELS